MPSVRPLPSRILAVASIAATVLVTLSACGSSSVSGADVAEQVSTQLARQIGQAPDDVTCPEDLAAEDGATTRCELTDGEQTYGVDVTVSSVEGGTVSFDIEVDGEPAS